MFICIVAIILKYNSTAFDTQPLIVIICSNERPAFIVAVALPICKLRNLEPVGSIEMNFLAPT
ncbi:15404_t:CDS:2 [Dentiscutata erythropus]|uniref:15404_t:CDS:1 n=1 Tax=Dentiscutata erythropus TaxID=1348616 RepID=A0A9N8ZRP6_9GLOM|nr:15404_t:CDS:2 [Dentiscutata erythropus]